MNNNINKNISVWRGNNTPPTEYHLWIKDDNSIWLYYQEQWHNITEYLLLATPELDGLMSSSDKSKLDNIENNAQVNVIESISIDNIKQIIDNKNVNLDTYTKSTIDSKIQEHTTNHNNPHEVTKLLIGLGNVDNTSDIDKPISTATLEALNNILDTVLNNKEELVNTINLHKSDNNNPHQVTKSLVGLGNVTNDALVKRSEMGVSNGIATLNDLGQVPAHLLPSFVDDVIDVYATYEKSDAGELSNIKIYSDPEKTIPITGESGKVYIDVESLYLFKWTGTVFVSIGAPTVIGDVPGTAFDGARGKALEDSVNSHISDTSNPHQVTKEQVGLGNVDNTSDLNKPISTATLSALNDKVDKVTGKSLVSDSQITKLEGLDDQDTLTSKIADAKKAGTDASSLAILNKNTIDNYTINGLKISTNPNLSKNDVGLSNVTNEALIPLSLRGIANGVATLDDAGKVPSSLLPSYVDDVLEYDTYDSFPETGESGKIYIDKQTNKQYRWGGTAYTEISKSLALGETSSTAYPGDKGKLTTDTLNSHVGNTSNPHNVTKALVGLGNVDNTSDTNKPVSTVLLEAINSAKTEAINTVGGYTINGKKINTNPTLNKGDIGLDLVDNTSDLDKPISNATLEALNKKVNLDTVFTDFSTSNNTTNITVGGVTKSLKINADLLDGLHYTSFPLKVGGNLFSTSEKPSIKLLTFKRSNEKGWLRLSLSDSNNTSHGVYSKFIIHWSIDNVNTEKSISVSCIYSAIADVSTRLTAVRVDGVTFALYYTPNNTSSKVQYLIEGYSDACTITDTNPVVEPTPTPTFTSYLVNIIGNLQGNADTAKKLVTPRTLWGLSFDGSSNISGDITSTKFIKEGGTSDQLLLANGDSTTLKTINGESALGEGNITVKSGVGQLYYPDGTGEIFNSYPGMLGENSAEGLYSHAEGNFNSASGKCSHAEGFYNKVNNDYLHAEGIYSFSRKGTTESDTPIHVIGIGTGERMQLNAVEIMRNGDYYIYGIGNYDGGINLSNAKTLQETINELPKEFKTINGLTITGSGDITIEGGGDYTLPIASANTLGGIKVGEGLNIDGEGVLSSTGSGVGQVDPDSYNSTGEVFNTYSSDVGGWGNRATGSYSHAEGHGTKASGSCAHTEGNRTTASEECAHAEGSSTTASGYYSHTEGVDTKAKGSGSHAEGINNTASGHSSHAEGNTTVANGDDSHTEGWNTITTNQAEHAQGMYNISNTGSTKADKTIHSIGIGERLKQVKRKNAVEVMVNGDVYINGIGNYDGTNYSSALTLLEVVNNKANSIGIVTGSTGEVTLEISPNKFYKFGECSTLTITLGAEISNVYNEYMFLFSSGDTPTVLTLPEIVKWIGDSLVDSNKTYLVSIVNNIAVMGGA